MGGCFSCFSCKDDVDDEETTPQKREYRCSNCQKTGHSARTCPLKECGNCGDETHQRLSCGETHNPLTATSPAEGKHKVTMQFKASPDEKRWTTELGDLLRDGKVSKHSKALAEQFGNRDFYGEHSHDLRMTDARLEKILKNKNLQVDHTLECQLLAHVMMNTGELRRVIKDINFGSSPKLPESLKPIRKMHNGAEEFDFFNLRLVSQGPNEIKGKVVQRFIKESDTRDETGDPFDLHAELVKQFKDGRDKFQPDTGDFERDRYAYAYAKQAVLGMKENLEQWEKRLHDGGGSGEQTRRQEALAKNMQELWGEACLYYA